MNKKAEAILDRIKKDKKLIVIISLGLAGMLLLLISGGSGNKAEKINSDEHSVSEIESRIERELTELIKSVDGAGRVKVMVTLDSLEERIVAKNNETGREADSYEEKNEYVLTESSGDTDGLTLKIITPVIRGVGISCEGATSETKKRELVKLVCSALGIAENRIWVTKMQE